MQDSALPVGPGPQLRRRRPAEERYPCCRPPAWTGCSPSIPPRHPHRRVRHLARAGPRLPPSRAASSCPSPPAPSTSPSRRHRPTTSTARTTSPPAPSAATSVFELVRSDRFAPPLLARRKLRLVRRHLRRYGPHRPHHLGAAPPSPHRLAQDGRRPTSSSTGIDEFLSLKQQLRRRRVQTSAGWDCTPPARTIARGDLYGPARTPPCPASSSPRLSRSSVFPFDAARLRAESSVGRRAFNTALLPKQFKPHVHAAQDFRALLLSAGQESSTGTASNGRNGAWRRFQYVIPWAHAKEGHHRHPARDRRLRPRQLSRRPQGLR